MAVSSSTTGQAGGQMTQVGDTELRCVICEEDFSDDIVPRNLGCGHSLCTLCLNHYFLKDKDKNCPECRRPFSAKSVSDLPVNYPLLRLSRSVVSSPITLQDPAPKTSSRTKTDEDGKIVIEDYGSGPVWRTNPSEFTCTISTPKKQSEFLGMKSYTAYTVTPSFSSKHVLRRYKQFDLIQEQLRVKFPLIVLPPLPEKQILGKFDEDVIEYRKRMLQFWINRICHHPILARSDIFNLFVTVSNERTWKTDTRKMKNDVLVYRNFFSSIEMPQSVLDLAQIENKLESYAYFVDELNKSVIELQSACLLQANNYQASYKEENYEISQAFMKFSQAFCIDSSVDALEISAIVLQISEAYSSICKMPVDELANEWQSFHDVASEYQAYIEGLNRILSVARRTVSKAYQLEVCDYHDATAALYVFQAEVAHFTQELVRDMKKAIKGILLRQFGFYQMVTEQLKDGLGKFVNEGEAMPSAPPLEVFD